MSAEQPNQEPAITKVKTRGRPKLVPNIEAVKRLAGQGLNAKQIALALGIDYASLKRRRRECEELDKAIEEGQAKAIAVVTNALYKMATEDHNVVAAIWFLKNRAPDQWKDKVEVATEWTMPAPLIIETVKEVGHTIDVTPEPTPTLKGTA